MRTLIIIPTYNEIDNIEKLLKSILTVVETNVSVLIVDDNSSDGTADAVQSMKKDNIFLLKRPCKMGLASAYIDGFKFGINNGFDTFIEFDADFSHNPLYLNQMIELLEDNDVVIGSRNIKGGGVKDWGFVRNLISKGGSLYSRMILNCPIYDLTGGFNGWKKEIIEKIGLDNIISTGYCFQIEMKYRAFLCNAKIAEFPIIFKDREFGKSKMSGFIVFEALINIFKLRKLSELKTDY